MKVQTGIAGKHDDLHTGMAFGDAMQVLGEVFATGLDPEKDDLRPLQSHLSEQVRHSAAFGHHDNVGTLGKDLPHPGQQQRVVVSNDDVYGRFPRSRNEAFGGVSGCTFRWFSLVIKSPYRERRRQKSVRPGFFYAESGGSVKGYVYWQCAEPAQVFLSPKL